MKANRTQLIGCVFIALAGIIGVSIANISRTVPTVAAVDNLPIIVLDAGHGGADGGAVGADNIIEKDINLNICLQLRDMLTVNGFQDIMTRDTDISIHDQGVEGLKRQKTSDLKNRLKIIQANPNTIAISIHQNKFSNASSKGAQVFFSPNNPNSERLAAIVQKNFVAQLQPDNTRQCKKAGKNLFLMYQAKCPAVLIECGFLSNKTEAHQLIDPEYQSKVAFSILGSILDYLEQDLPQPQDTPITDVTQ